MSLSFELHEWVQCVVKGIHAGSHTQFPVCTNNWTLNCNVALQYVFPIVFPYVLMGISSAYYAHCLPTTEYFRYAIKYNLLHEEPGPASIYFLVHICPLPYDWYPDSFGEDWFTKICWISSCVQQSAGKRLSSLFVAWGITCLESFDAISDYITLQIGVPYEK